MEMCSTRSGMRRSRWFDHHNDRILQRRTMSCGPNCRKPSCWPSCSSAPARVPPAAVSKVCRFVILLKSIRHEIHKIHHPNAVTIVVKLNGKDSDRIRCVANVYFAAYVFILVASVLIVSIDNFDFATSFSGVLTTINNVDRVSRK